MNTRTAPHPPARLPHLSSEDLIAPLRETEAASSDIRQIEDYQRITAAIRFLEHHWRRRPELAEIAAAVDLSPFHFQRLFSRWAGISPKRFVQFLRLVHGRQLLRGSASLLNVSTALDLSGPSRLHDLFVTIDAVTPGEFKRGGDGVTITYGVHPTRFGYCVLGATPRGVCTLVLLDDDELSRVEHVLREYWPRAALRPAPSETAGLAARIFAAPDPRMTPAPDESLMPATAAGRAPAAPLKLHLRGTNFQLKVWEALLRIPPGRICSYEMIAAAIGQPKAARAVGQAVGANPISYLIPCHRVIRSSGHLGGYGGGLPRKQAILAAELAEQLVE